MTKLLINLTFLIIIVGFGVLIAVPVLAQSSPEQQTKTLETVGISTGAATLLNQGINEIKNRMSKPSQTPLAGEDPSGECLTPNHLYGLNIRIQNLEKNITKASRQIRHLENFLIKTYPDKFNPRDTV